MKKSVLCSSKLPNNNEDVFRVLSFVCLFVCLYCHLDLPRSRRRQCLRMIRVLWCASVHFAKERAQRLHLGRTLFDLDHRLVTRTRLIIHERARRRWGAVNAGTSCSVLHRNATDRHVQGGALGHRCPQLWSRWPRNLCPSMVLVLQPETN